MAAIFFVQAECDIATIKMENDDLQVKKEYDLVVKEEYEEEEDPLLIKQGKTGL